MTGRQGCQRGLHGFIFGYLLPAVGPINKRNSMTTAVPEAHRQLGRFGASALACVENLANGWAAERFRGTSMLGGSMETCEGSSPQTQMGRPGRAAFICRRCRRHKMKATLAQYLISHTWYSVICCVTHVPRDRHHRFHEENCLLSPSFIIFHS